MIIGLGSNTGRNTGIVPPWLRRAGDEPHILTCVPVGEGNAVYGLFESDALRGVSILIV